MGEKTSDKRMFKAEGTFAKTLRRLCASLLRNVGSDPGGESDWPWRFSNFSLSQNQIKALLKQVIWSQLQSF